MTPRLRMTLVAMLAGSALLATPAAAQDNALRITGFALANADGDQAVNFTITTEGARPIPADAIDLKIQDNVVRVTFTNVPLAKEAGLHVDFDTDGVRHVIKGYALKENNTQSFARLKFDTRAAHAFEGWTIEPTDGGSTIRLPFGDIAPVAPAVVAAAEVPEAPVQKLDAPAPSPDMELIAAPEVGPTVEAPPMAAVAPPSAAADTKAQGGLFDWAQKSDTPAAAAETPAASTATPLTLADSERGPSMTRVAGGLAVVVVLILALAFCVKKLRGFKGMVGGWRPPADGVKLLSTHKVGRSHNVLILDVLGEHLVVGQGPGGMNLLYKLPQGRLADLQGAEAQGQTDSRSVLAGLLGKLRSEPALDADADIDEDSLADLARSLESDHSLPLRPTTGQNVRVIRPDQAVTASSDAEPKDFEELVQRRLQRAQERLTDQREATRRDPELESMAINIRDRARALGRL